MRSVDGVERLLLLPLRHYPTQRGGRQSADTKMDNDREENNMLKLIAFTDPHYSEHPPAGRTDSYGTDILTKLQEVQSIANKADADAVLFAGDMFHRKADVLMREVRLIAEWLKGFSCPVYGILGNHDLSAYQESSKENRAAGVLEAAGLIQWLSFNEEILLSEGKHRIVLSGRSYCKDYDVPASYGCEYKKENDDDILVWLSHGTLTDEEDLPYESTPLKKIIRKCQADILINGHYHSKVIDINERGTKVICPGSIGRVARPECHTPSIAIIAIDGNTGISKHKLIALKSAKECKEVFTDMDEDSGKQSDDDIRAFVETLRKDSEDLRDADLKAVIDVACEGKPEGVKEAVMARTGL